ncbi:MAG: thiamine phosphate synthase [Alphaproteobacteria bacterium]
MPPWSSPSPDHKAERCRLYLITPPALELDSFADVLADALDGGDVACVQLRLAEVGEAELLAAARVLMPICHQRDVAFLIDGRADIAAQASADGVHLASPSGVVEARLRLSQDAIIGVSCGGSRHAGMLAAEAEVDYVSFGAFYPSTTKPDANVIEPDILSWWDNLMETPCAAVGGITVATAPAMVAAGANFLAISAAVWGHAQGPGAAVAAFNAAIESVSPT